MTLAAIKAEIERIIGHSDYSKEEVLSYLNAEEKLDVEELLAYGVALEYLKQKKTGDYKKMEKVFLKKKADMMDRYL